MILHYVIIGLGTLAGIYLNYRFNRQIVAYQILGSITIAFVGALACLIVSGVLYFLDYSTFVLYTALSGVLIMGVYIGVSLVLRHKKLISARAKAKRPAKTALSPAPEGSQVAQVHAAPVLEPEAPAVQSAEAVVPALEEDLGLVGVGALEAALRVQDEAQTPPEEDFNLLAAQIVDAAIASMGSAAVEEETTEPVEEAAEEGEEAAIEPIEEVAEEAETAAPDEEAIEEAEAEPEEITEKEEEIEDFEPVAACIEVEEEEAESAEEVAEPVEETAEEEPSEKVEEEATEAVEEVVEEADESTEAEIAEEAAEEEVIKEEPAGEVTEKETDESAEAATEEAETEPEEEIAEKEEETEDFEPVATCIEAEEEEAEDLSEEAIEEEADESAEIAPEETEAEPEEEITEEAPAEAEAAGGGEETFEPVELAVTAQEADESGEEAVMQGETPVPEAEAAKETPAPQSRADALLTKARLLAAQSHYRIALDLLDACAREAEDDGVRKSADILMAQCLVGMEDYAGAKEKTFEILKKGYALNPDDKRALKAIFTRLSDRASDV